MGEGHSREGRFHIFNDQEEEDNDDVGWEKKSGMGMVIVMNGFGRGDWEL